MAHKQYQQCADCGVRHANSEGAKQACAGWRRVAATGEHAVVKGYWNALLTYSSNR